MPYSNIPGTTAAYLDGGLALTTATPLPVVMVIGAARSGRNYEPYNINGMNAAEQEFGADSEVMQLAHEVFAQGADNLRIVRAGGRKGKLTLEDSASNTLVIIPELRDDEAMSTYSLVLDGSGAKNRILIWDNVRLAFVYDSDQEEVINTGRFRVLDSGLDRFSVGTLNDSTTYIAFDDLVTGDFTQNGAASMATVTAEAGADGLNMSYPERYAAYNAAYMALDYRDTDFIVPFKAYLDAPNVVDGDSVNFFKGVPVSGMSNDGLGYLWEYVYQGRKYTYFVDTDDYFSVSGVAATELVNTDLVLTAEKTGTGGNNISIEIDSTDTSPVTVVITEPDADSLHIAVSGDAGTDDTSDAVSAINTALSAYTMLNGQLASTLVQASGGGITALTDVASTSLASGAGGHVLTPEDLTGDPIPSAVSTRFAAGADAELREANFAHQLASFCFHASTQWKSISGATSVAGPPGVDRDTVSEWVGTLPTYTQIGRALAVSGVGDNGSGLLGNKFMGGASGYRSGMVPLGDGNDGYAYGGFIATKGTGLPNGASNAYGVNDGDERLDANGKPVDIGKHIWVTMQWVTHNNAYNGGVRYPGPTHGTFVGKLVVTPENRDPIVLNGLVTRLGNPLWMHATQEGELIQARYTVMRTEEDTGIGFVSADTGAHPTDSDYVRGSTIRCANRILNRIRRIARPFLGEAFTPEMVSSLQSAIDGYIRAERINEIHQGCLAPITFTRNDRIIGKLTIKVRMVPPFSIREIFQELSLSADESEL